MFFLEQNSLWFTAEYENKEYDINPRQEKSGAAEAAYKNEDCSNYVSLKATRTVVLRIYNLGPSLAFRSVYNTSSGLQHNARARRT